MSINGSPQRLYDSIRLKGPARAILGDCHTHHHYYGALSTRNSSARQADRNELLEDELLVTASNGESSPELISDYDAALARWLRSEPRLADTCNWIFSVPEYKRWKADLGPDILLCTGSVGCGKSVTAAVLDHLHAELSHGKGVVVSYFVDTLQAHQIKADDILRALIKQLLLARQETDDTLEAEFLAKLHTLFSSTTTLVPHSSQLITLAKELCNGNLKTYFVLDGIDGLTEDAIIRLLGMMKELTASIEANQSARRILIFCRESLGRGIRFENDPRFSSFQIALKHVESDIHAFVDHEVTSKQDERSLIQSRDLLDEVVNVLKSNSAKMFLWVKLQVATIWDPDMSTCDADIRQQLQRLPDGLDQTYIQCLRRIEATQARRSAEIAPRAFKWVASAARPLSQTEARELVSIDPDALPLTSDNILSLPVTDYCCNLVVVNNLTGYLEFAHATVRDLLSDATKMPPDLSRFLLSTQEDNSWCGTICLRYIEQHRSRSRLIPVNRQRIPTRVSMPIFRTISDNLLSGPLRMRYLSWSASQDKAEPEAPDHVLLQLPDADTKRASEVRDFVAHHYLCQYWPAHTRDLPQASQIYSNFQELCLGQDAEFQPWVTAKVSRSEQYRFAVQYAVLTDHLPLLSTIIDHLDQCGMHQAILKNPCPGTGSSFLHVASTLGHLGVTSMLLIYGLSNFADTDGKSAASIALEAGHTGLFRTLLQDLSFETKGSPINSLVDFQGRRSEENILLRVVDVNEAQAVDPVVLKCKCEQQYLSQAVIRACKAGKVNIAHRLVFHGADPNLWYECAPGDSQLTYPTSSLRQALLGGNLNLVKTLFEVGATLASKVRTFDIFDVATMHINGEISKDDAEYLVKVLANYQPVEEPYQVSRETPLTTPMPATKDYPPRIILPAAVLDRIDDFLDSKSHMTAFPFFQHLRVLAWANQTTSKSFITTNFWLIPWLEMIIRNRVIVQRPRFWNCYLRILLDNSSRRPVEDVAARSAETPLVRLYLRQIYYEVEDLQEAVAEFFKFVSDDILVRILQQKLIGAHFLFRLTTLGALTQRGTSRGLQAVAETYIPPKSLIWGNPASLDLCCSFKAQSHQAGKFFQSGNPPNLEDRCHGDTRLKSPFRDYLDFHGIELSYDISRVFGLPHFLSGEEPNFCNAFENYMLTQNLCRNQQVVMFFAATSLRQVNFLLALDSLRQKSKARRSKPRESPGRLLTLEANIRLMSLSNQHDWAYRVICDAMIAIAINDMSIQDIGGRLMMLRCYLQTRDLAKATVLRNSLESCKSDANFALNYPAGYVLDANGRPVMSKTITLAIYAWNYRLRRKRNCSFSVADSWFIGLRILEYLHTKTIWHKAVEVAGHVPCSTASDVPHIRPFHHPRDLVWSRGGSSLFDGRVYELHAEHVQPQPRLKPPIHRCDDPLARFELAVSYSMHQILLAEYDR